MFSAASESRRKHRPFPEQHGLSTFYLRLSTLFGFFQSRPGDTGCLLSTVYLRLSTFYCLLPQSMHSEIDGAGVMHDHRGGAVFRRELRRRGQAHTQSRLDGQQ